MVEALVQAPSERWPWPRDTKPVVAAPAAATTSRPRCAPPYWKPSSKLGGSAYLVRVAKENPAAFCTLLGKLLPHELATSGGPLKHEVVLRWMTPEMAKARGLVEG